MKRDVPGFAVGGLSGGEAKEQFWRFVPFQLIIMKFLFIWSDFFVEEWWQFLQHPFHQLHLVIWWELDIRCLGSLSFFLKHVSWLMAVLTGERQMVGRDWTSLVKTFGSSTFMLAATFSTRRPCKASSGKGLLSELTNNLVKSVILK